MTSKLTLTLGDELMRIAESATDQHTTFQINLASMSEQFFPDGRLKASALENAIEWTEDRLQLAQFSKPENAFLYTSDFHVQKLYLAAGIKVADGALLHVDAVEQTFSRLVMQANGQAPGQDLLPEAGVFYSTLVVVRELMHHLKFPFLALYDVAGNKS